MRKIWAPVLVIILIIAAYVRINTPGRDVEGFRSFTRPLMGTYVTVQVPDTEEAELAAEKALGRIREVSEKFSIYHQESPVYAFNNYREPLTDPEITALTRKAVEISRETGGAFDITVYHLVRLWDFSSEDPKVPDESRILSALEKTGYARVVIEEGEVKPYGEYGLDFGGIAKGYAVDEAVSVLKSEGVRDALVDAGGDIYVMGRRGGRPWRVGIRDPRDKSLSAGVVELSNKAVVTSGGYENYFIYEGERYHHILDPRTGYPVTGPESVTVTAPDAATADSWATALFVMGQEEGLKSAELQDGIEALFITGDGDMVKTEGFRVNPPRGPVRE